MKLQIIYLPLVLLMAISASVSGGPLSGTYTIGPSGNYTSFTAAVSALTSSGISGPVTFNVATGTYTEQITIGPITGASRTKRITFQSATGNPADVTLTWASNSTTDLYNDATNSVIYLNGASYINIKNLTIVNTGPLNIVSAASAHPSGAIYYSGYYLWAIGEAIIINDGAQNDSLVGNILTVPSNLVTGNPGDYYYSPNALGQAESILLHNVITMFADTYTQPDDSIVITGNTINNGILGIQAEASLSVRESNGLVIANNFFYNQIESSIYMSGVNNAQVVGNLIVDTLFDAGYQCFGIGVSMNCSQVRVLKNKIYASREPIYVANSSDAVGKEGLIADNFLMGFSIGGSASYSAVTVIQSSNKLIYNNSMVSTHVSYGGLATFTAQSDTGIAVLNNIFYNMAGGEAIAVNDIHSLSVCDYNDYYTTRDTMANWHQWYNYIKDLATWQDSTGFDAHSRFLPPPFVSYLDFHLTDYPLMRFGTPLALVPDDIDGNIRSLSVTDVGASELPLGTSFTASATRVCTGTRVTFTDQSSGSPIAWSWTFTGGTPSAASSQNPVVVYYTPGNYAVKLVATGSSGTDSITVAGYITVIAIPATSVLAALPDSVCSGNASVLSATGSAGSLQWQSSLNDTTFSDISGADSAFYITPPLTATTNYRLITSNGLCADTSTAIAVVVNPLPSPPVLTVSDSAICPYDSALISASGIYSSYLWNNGDSRSYTYTSQTGNYWVTATDANGCTAVSTPQHISVSPSAPVPVAYTADSAFCPYDSVLISASGIYSSYLWNNGDSRSYTYASQTGNYWVSVTDANGCTAVSTPQYISVYPSTPVPVAYTADSAFCASDSTLITASAGYSAYRWNNGDTAQSQYVYTAGNYYVTVTDANGCTATSNHLSISVYPVPEVSITQQGDTLSSFGQPGYQWIFNDTPIPGATNPVYIAHQSGSYTVQVTDTNGCTSISNPVDVTVHTGIENLPDENISIYPNPSTGNYQLSVDNNLLGSSLEVYDDQARLVFKSTIRNPQSAINLDVASGIYYLRISVGADPRVRPVVRKLVKM